MHNVIVVVSCSFLGVCVSALSTRKVLDTHMGFQVPFQGTSIGKFLTTMLTRFFGEFKLFLSSSVRVPSLILCLRMCLFRPSPWMKPSPHWSHLSKFNYIQQCFVDKITWRVFHQCVSSHVCPIFAALQTLVHKNCIGKVLRGRAQELHERSTCQHWKNSPNKSATFWVK